MIIIMKTDYFHLRFLFKDDLHIPCLRNNGKVLLDPPYQDIGYSPHPPFFKCCRCQQLLFSFEGSLLSLESLRRKAPLRFFFSTEIRFRLKLKSFFYRTLVSDVKQFLVRESTLLPLPTTRAAIEMHGSSCRMSMI